LQGSGHGRIYHRGFYAGLDYFDSVCAFIYFQGKQYKSVTSNRLRVSINTEGGIMKKHKNSKSGQSMVEYIIIVLIIAIAALAIVGVFSDRVRELFGFATEQLGGDGAAVGEALSDKSVDWVKEAESENSPR
jgi:Flp pilus assembly pilin Flp